MHIIRSSITGRVQCVCALKIYEIYQKEVITVSEILECERFSGEKWGETIFIDEKNGDLLSLLLSGRISKTVTNCN